MSAFMIVIIAAIGSFSLSLLKAAERTTDIGVRRAISASRGQVTPARADSVTLNPTIATTIGIGIA